MYPYKTPEEAADELLRLYREHGMEDYIGESVSQIEHMCQCAQLAEVAGYEDDIVLAAFFHDVGHLLTYDKDVISMNGLGVRNHEQMGADYLRSLGFNEKIAALVEGHVSAKRYLTFNSGEYYNRLSDASKKTLEYQGGKMSEEEAAIFENDDLFELHIQLRMWDDKGKVQSQPIPSLNKFRELIIKHLTQQNITDK